jgi:hypothetical protein
MDAVRGGEDVPVGYKNTPAELLAIGQEGGNPRPFPGARGSAAGNATLVSGAEAAATRRSALPGDVLATVGHQQRLLAFGCKRYQSLTRGRDTLSFLCPRGTYKSSSVLVLYGRAKPIEFSTESDTLFLSERFGKFCLVTRTDLDKPSD